MKEKDTKKMKQIIFYITSGIVVTATSLGMMIPSIISENKPIEIQENYAPKDEEIEYSATLSVVGDIMAHKPILDANYNKKKDSYSFQNNFKYVKEYLNKSDYTIGNLETTFAGKSIPYSSYPLFNTPDSLSNALKSCGFDMLSTINNHSFDKGDLGFFRTLEVLKEKNIETIGTKETSDENNYVVKDINNIKFGITAFSYGELKGNKKYLNGIELTKKASDKANIFPQADANVAFKIMQDTLKSIESEDMQVVIMHWGEEYQREPNKFQKELAQLLCDNGVDIIVGSHPHVVQPVEMITSTDGSNETLVIYSLGNFISNQRREYLGTPYTEDGLIVDIEILKSDKKDKAYISKVKCIPTWVNKYNANGKVKYEIIPLSDKELISNNLYIPKEKAKASYENTASQIKQSKIIKVAKNPFK